MINILEYFNNTVRKYPLKTAVKEDDKTITFRDLQTSMMVLADIIGKFNYRNRPIAVMLPKSIDCVIADLAVTYSGNIYMNLDTKSPRARVINILREIKPALVITKKIYADNFPETNCIFIETLDLSTLDMNNPIMSFFGRIDTDPLCIINTSGSTGTPKGVVLNHRSFIDFTDWAVKTLELWGEEVIGSLSPVIFDIFSFELCMMMATGSTIVIIPARMAAFPVEMIAMMKEENVSFIFWVPSIMVRIANLDLIRHSYQPTLRKIWFAGEVFPTKQFNYWKKAFPWAQFVNLYGPIEITLDCTYFIANRPIADDEPIPIGWPCRNTDVLILNEKNELSDEGELCVRGSSLAMGYYNNPEKTAEVFVQNPLNRSYPEIIYRTGDYVSKNSFGELMFKGRKDTLIKHMGYRIELSEIEHVIINTLKLVDNGCAVYDFKANEIVFFYESGNPLPDAADTFRKTIGSTLPKYIIPNKFLKLPSLPLNENGKVDRLQLTKML